jgi:carboxymethylenebutenolidase
MEQPIIDLYDAFTHGVLARREFLARLADLAGGASAATALLAVLGNDYARAAVIAPDDPRIEAGPVSLRGPRGAVRAYRARPIAEDRAPALIVIHENRGLNPHIEDVTRRAAAEGFLAIAPDALSDGGGTPDDPDRARERIGELDPDLTRRLFLEAVDHAREHPASTGRVGCVGFCWGGAMANQLAVHSATLGAAVSFYGRQPATEDVPRIRCPLQLHYAGLDERINAGIAAFEAALRQAGVEYELHLYEGVNHAFHNDTAPARYDEAAAKLAWQRTLAFLRRHLGGLAQAK